MTFIPVSWSNNDDITEVKLDQMIANDVHVRAEIDAKNLISDGPEEIAVASVNSFRLQIDGSDIGAGVETGVGDGPFMLNESDIDVGALSPGLYKLSAVGPSGTSVYRFVKTEDTVYLSYFVTLGRRLFDGETETYSRDFSVIGHRETKGWSA